MSARTRPFALWMLGIALMSLGACGESDIGEADEPVGDVASWIERGPLRVHVGVDRDELTVAESLTLTIEASAEPGYVLDLPNLGDRDHEGDVSVAPLRIVDERREPAHMDARGRIVESVTLVLEPYLPGEVEIPAITVRARPIEGAGEAIEASTRPIAVTVRSLLESDDLELAELRDVIDPAYAIEIPVGGVVAALIIAGGLVCGIVLIGRRLIMEPLPPSTIDEARERLEILVRRELEDEDERKSTLLEVSDLLRACIASRTDRRATRMSERELRRLIRDRHTLDTHEQLALCGLVRELDEVIFSGRAIDADRTRALVRSVIEQLPVIERCGLHFAGTNDDEEESEAPPARRRRWKRALTGKESDA